MAMVCIKLDKNPCLPISKHVLQAKTVKIRPSTHLRICHYLLLLYKKDYMAKTGFFQAEHSRQWGKGCFFAIIIAFLTTFILITF